MRTIRLRRPCITLTEKDCGSWTARMTGVPALRLKAKNEEAAKREAILKMSRRVATLVAQLKKYEPQLRDRAKRIREDK